MSLEKEVKDIVQTKLTDGTIEKIIEQQFEKGINNALSDLFSSYGDVTRAIKKQVQSVIVPYVENYDYSQYIVKLETVLNEVLKETTTEHKELLNNFKELMGADIPREMNMSELFNKYCKYVEGNADTDDLEIDYDEEPTYESIELNMSFTQTDQLHDWSKRESGIVAFEAEKQDMNFEIPLYRYSDFYKENHWSIDFDNRPIQLSSLQNKNSFDVFLLALKQKGTEIILDTDYEDMSVIPEEKPEPQFV